jgi:nucleoside-diphosphate-sugar epimerase
VVGAFLGNFADVRTVADAHVKAIQVAEAAGNRFIISAGPFSWQDACKCQYIHFPFHPSPVLDDDLLSEYR